LPGPFRRGLSAYPPSVLIRQRFFGAIGSRARFANRKNGALRNCNRKLESFPAPAQPECRFDSRFNLLVVLGPASFATA